MQLLEEALKVEGISRYATGSSLCSIRANAKRFYEVNDVMRKEEKERENHSWMRRCVICAGMRRWVPECWRGEEWYFLRRSENRTIFRWKIVGKCRERAKRSFRRDLYTENNTLEGIVYFLKYLVAVTEWTA